MKMIRKKLLLLALISLTTFCYCQRQLEAGGLDVEKVNFNSFNAKTFYATALKAEWSDYHKKRNAGVKPIYFFRAETDTIDRTGQNFNIDTAFAIQYRQTGIGRSGWEKDYSAGFFRNLKFNEINAITDLDNNLLLLSGATDRIEPEKLDSFIVELNKAFGNAYLTDLSKGLSSYQLRKWELEDRIIVLASAGVIDYKGLVLTEKEKAFIKSIENDNFLSATLFSCRKDVYDTFKQMSMRTGFMTSFEK